MLGESILLLTFDEFDTLAREEIHETLAKPLIAYLRRLMGLEGLNFIYSIGSSGNKLENMQASYTDFFKAALYRKISFLTQDDCHRLVTKPVEGVLEYEPQAVDRIYEITSGHPYFTQLTCHELFSLSQKTGKRQINMEDVNSVIEDVIERGTVNLKFVWDEASGLEKWVLASLAHLKGQGTIEEIGQVIREQRVRFSLSDLKAAVLHLREKDVIDSDNQFVIYLLLLWVQRNRPLDRVQVELIETNPIANRYIEIGDEYRDLGQRQTAIDSYQQALDVNPGNLRALVNMAEVHLERDEYQQAIVSFRQALQIDAGDVPSRAGLCGAYLALGDKASIQEEGIKDAIEYYQKILEINADHSDARQRLADTYHAQAEEQLKAGNDDQALNYFNQALEYTPEDVHLLARFDEILEMKKAKVIAGWLEKADQAQAEQHWDEAVEAVEQALRLSPEDASLQAKLAETKEAPRQHQLQMLKSEADQAVGAENWQGAISALEEYLELEPDSPEILTQITTLREKERQARLVELEARAKAAATAGRWDHAIQAWDEYLGLEPDVRQPAEQALAYAQKYRKIAQHYAEAQQAIQKKRYTQAIELLQGIIAQDPAYKATSRLLVEAVEASKRFPLWRRGRFYAIIAVLILVALGVFGGPKVIEALKATAEATPIAAELPATESEERILSTNTPKPTQVHTRTLQLPTLSPTNPSTAAPTLTATLSPAQVFAQPILAYVADTPPDFEDDFSTLKDDWDLVIDSTSQPDPNDYVSGGAFVFQGAFADDRVMLGDLGGVTPLTGTNFVLQFDLSILETETMELIIRFQARGPQSGYNFLLRNSGGWGILPEGGAGMVAEGKTAALVEGEANRLQMIAYDKNVLIYLNDILISGFQALEPDGDKTNIEIGTFSSAYVEIDNLKFWNLDGRDF
jgi:tetratricopeptide (TPR) repeat protein